MDRKKASARKLKPLFLRTLFTVGCLFTGLSTAAGVQENRLNPLEPFKQCRIDGNSRSETSRIFASDNDNNIILFNGNSVLISTNLESGFENWKQQTGGKPQLPALIDENSLFFLTVTKNSNGQPPKFILNSVSLKTGIANWQKVFENSENLRILTISDSSAVFVQTENSTVQAVLKTDGKPLWTRKFAESWLAFDESTRNGQIDLLTPANLLKISTDEGLIGGKYNLPKALQGSPPILKTLRGKAVVIGLSTGEILKLGSYRERSEIQWKIKTGGSVTGIVEVGENILVTSLDNFIYLFSVERGNLRWKKRVSGRIVSEPLTFEGHAFIQSVGDNIASIIDLKDGKRVNQIRLEDDVFFSGEPFQVGKFLILQTTHGIRFFANQRSACN